MKRSQMYHFICPKYSTATGQSVLYYHYNHSAHCLQSKVFPHLSYQTVSPVSLIACKCTALHFKVVRGSICNG